MIKKFEEFVNEDLDFRNELYMYSHEECGQIDEGFKDFIKKFALTAAIATACISSMSARDYAAKNPNQLEKIKKEIKAEGESNLKKYAKIDKDCNLYTGQSAQNKSTALNLAQINFNKKFGGKANIVGTHTIETKSDSGNTVYQCVIVYCMR